jgi:hypothetical protein
MKPVTEYLHEIIINAYPEVAEKLKNISTSQWLDALTSNERDEARVSAALGIQIPAEIFQELIINTELGQLVRVFPKQTNKVLKALKENHASSSLAAKILFPELSLSDAQIEINKVILGNDKFKKQFELLLDKEIENINKLLRIDIDLSLSIDQQHALILHRLALVYGLRPALPQEYYTPQLIKDIRSYQTDEDPFDFDGALLGSLLYFIKDIEIENQKVTARNLSIQINQWLKENQLTLSETMINQLIHNANLSEKIHLEELKIESAAEKPLLAAAEFDANTQKKEFLKRIMSKYEWSAHKAMQDERLAHINDANHLLEVLLEEGLMSVYEKNIKEKAKKIIGECKEDFKLLINYLKYEKSYIKELGISEQLAQLVEDRLLDLSSFLSGTHETLKVTDKKTVDEQKLKHLPTAYYNDHQKDLNSLLLVEFFDIEIVDAIWVYTHYYLSLNFVDVRSYKGLKEINDYLIKTSKKIDHRWNAVAQLNEEDMLNGWPFEILEGKKINGLAPAKAKILSEGEWQEILTEHPLLVETLRLQIENWAQDYLKKDVPEIIRQLASADNRLLNHFKTYFPHYHDLRAKLIEFANKEFNGMSADMIEKRFKISKAQFSWFTNQIKY